MKKQIILIISCVLASVLLLMPEDAFAKEANTSNVFDGDLLSTINTYGVSTAFTYNDNGQLVKIGSEYGTMAGIVTFDYASGIRGDFEYDMSMKYVDDETTETYYIKVGDDGFATSAMHYSRRDIYSVCHFEYNENCQLTKFTEDGEAYEAVYNEAGDIIKVYEGDGVYGQYEISYTDESQPTKIDNRGGLMLFSLFYQIEMDALDFAYFAGILGKPTKHLPVSKRIYSEASSISYELNEKGYVETMSFCDIYDDVVTISSFTWNAQTSSPAQLLVQEDGPSQWFTITGCPVTKPSSGLYLKKMADGSVRKVIIK